MKPDCAVVCVGSGHSKTTRHNGVLGAACYGGQARGRKMATSVRNSKGVSRDGEKNATGAIRGTRARGESLRALQGVMKLRAGQWKNVSRKASETFIFSIVIVLEMR